MAALRVIRDFPSSPEGFSRTLRVLLPDAYAQQPSRRFPVLYMHDGQNVFAHPESAVFDTWCANRAVEALVMRGSIDPWIVVGIDSGPSRMSDYSPWRDATMDAPGRADVYLRFLVDELKPWVDRSFRTRTASPSTAIAGASLGGLVSLYAGLRYPDVFGPIGAFSPSVMWAGRRMFDEWRAHTRHWSRIYLDAGADEQLVINGHLLDYGPATRDFGAHLRHLGYQPWELVTVLEPGGQHHERDWQRRLPAALEWLLRR
jgi:predicted alpha/beta superfamily hydrolase